MAEAVSEQNMARSPSARRRGESLGAALRHPAARPHGGRMLRRRRSSTSPSPCSGYVGCCPTSRSGSARKYEAPSLQPLEDLSAPTSSGARSSTRSWWATRTAMTIGFVVTGISLPIGISARRAGGLLRRPRRRPDRVALLGDLVGSLHPADRRHLLRAREGNRRDLHLRWARSAGSGLCRLIRGEVHEAPGSRVRVGGAPARRQRRASSSSATSCRT